MGKLPYLESLTITDFSSLKVIGREFLGINDHNNEAEFVSFPELVKLEIDSCTLLEGWEDLKPEDEGRITVMPKLEAIRIRGCKKFTKLPFWLHLKLSSLKELELDDGNFILQSEQLENGILSALPQCPSLGSLNIQKYEATKLPNWLMYEATTNIQE
ncbi:hypothetical protein LIER_42260 [Lithospermum erythrorhizon]|uniref:Uncharacterized protein n=1 Tax=Lithospermum erythrorhizon TaxID=34254 RepID=A0AAV3RLP5_LITER